MYESRVLAFSDLKRDTTLAKIKDKYTNTTILAERAISVDLFGLVDAQVGPYHTARMLKNSKAAVYYHCVVESRLAVENLHQLESQFVQVFNFGVKRKINPLFLASDRAYYGLPIGTGNQPKLTTEDEIMNFAPVLVEGDAARMAVVGAVAMVFPTAAEIDLARADARIKINAESVAKDAFGTASRALAALNLIVDPLIKQCADAAEAFFSALTDSAKREACTDWGNVYISVGSGSVLKFTVLDFTTHEPVDLMEGQVNQNGDSALSDATGVLILNTTVVGTAAVNFSKIDSSTGLETYEPYAFDITIVDKSNVQYTVYVKKLA